MSKTLRVYKQDESGCNIQFIDILSKKIFSLNEIIINIRIGGEYSSDYSVKQNSNGTLYIASKPDGNPINNIE